MIANWEGAEGAPRSLTTAERRAAMHDRWIQHCRECMATFSSTSTGETRGSARSSGRAASQLPGAESNNADDSQSSSPEDPNSTLSTESNDLNKDGAKQADVTADEVHYRPYELSTSRRIWAISDIHVDFPANMSWLFSLPKKDADGIDYSAGTLILAGDVCHALPMLGTTLRLFKKKFRHVFYCVGNHELWLHATRSTPAPAIVKGESPSKPSFTNDFEDSMEKFFAIMNLCRDIGIHTTPAIVTADRSVATNRDVLIVPLQSWYTPRWVEGSEEFRSEKFPMGLQGFDGQCLWPRGVGNPQDARDSLWDSISDFFMTLNSVFLNGIVEFKQRYIEKNVQQCAAHDEIAEQEQIFAKNPKNNAELISSSSEPDLLKQASFRSDLPRTQCTCDSSSTLARELEIISFSHFLPRPELYPVWNKYACMTGTSFNRAVDMLALRTYIAMSSLCLHSLIAPLCVLSVVRRYPATKPLLAVLGCPRLGQTVTSLQSDTHIFGHSHFSMDTRLPLSLVSEEASGSKRSDCNTAVRYCRFVQQSLAYPRERKRRPKLPSAHDERQRTMPKPVWPSR